MNVVRVHFLLFPFVFLVFLKSSSHISCLVWTVPIFLRGRRPCESCCILLTKGALLASKLQGNPCSGRVGKEGWGFIARKQVGRHNDAQTPLCGLNVGHVWSVLLDADTLMLKTSPTSDLKRKVSLSQCCRLLPTRPFVRHFWCPWFTVTWYTSPGMSRANPAKPKRTRANVIGWERKEILATCSLSVDKIWNIKGNFFFWCPVFLEAWKWHIIARTKTSHFQPKYGQQRKLLATWRDKSAQKEHQSVKNRAQFWSWRNKQTRHCALKESFVQQAEWNFQLYFSLNNVDDYFFCSPFRLCTTDSSMQQDTFLFISVGKNSHTNHRNLSISAKQLLTVPSDRTAVMDDNLLSRFQSADTAFPEGGSPPGFRRQRIPISSAKGNDWANFITVDTDGPSSKLLFLDTTCFAVLCIFWENHSKGRCWSKNTRQASEINIDPKCSTRQHNFCWTETMDQHLLWSTT